MSEIMKTEQENSIIANIVLNGDISQLKPDEKVKYYNMFCDSLGLNSVTQPFDIIKLQGKERLYAKKECTDQLRKLNGVSIIDLKKTFDKDLYIVEVKARDKTGKIDIATGALSIMNLKGNDLANALMKCETKAKRRVTLSICGLGILDETELEEIPEFSNETENILKNVSQNIGKEKPTAIGFSEKSDSERRKNELLEIGRPFQKVMNDEEINFFKEIKNKKLYSEKEYSIDKVKVLEIEKSYKEIENILDSEVVPEFLLESEKEKDDELPKGVM
jgi:hypothetical protein